MDTASGAPQAYPSTPGLYHLTTQADGDTVYYTLRIPAGYDGHTAPPGMTGASAVLQPASGRQGARPAARRGVRKVFGGAGGYGHALGEYTSGRAAGGTRGTDVVSGKGRLNFLYLGL